MYHKLILCLPPYKAISQSIFSDNRATTLSPYFPNMVFNMVLPILRSRPAFDVGMPVCLANCCFALVTPRALFQEKDNPGIFINFFWFSVRIIIRVRWLAIEINQVYPPYKGEDLLYF